MEILVLVVVAVVILFVIGILVVGLAFKLLWWALVGLALGALARLILPGEQRIGLLATALSGIGAAFLGGVIAHVVGVGSVLQFVIAVVVAVVVVGVVSGSEHATT